MYEKNVELLFDIYDEVEAEGIDVNFIVAGDGVAELEARGGGSQALVEDGINGFLCDPNNPSHFIEKIKLLLNDVSIRKKMRKAGKKYLPLLNWNNLASIYFSDIEKLGYRKRDE